jgi:hypothetical protein
MVMRVARRKPLKKPREQLSRAEGDENMATLVSSGIYSGREEKFSLLSDQKI